MSFMARMAGAQSRAARRRATSGDPLRAQVVLHLPGGDLTDVSTYGRTLTANGDTHAGDSTTNFTGATSLAFDGSGDYLSTDGSDFDLGTTPFNIRVWVRPTATTNNFGGIVASGQGGWTAGCVNLLQFGTGWGVDGSQQGRLAFAGNMSGLAIMSAPVTVGNWYFVEVDRDESGDVKMWVNGTFCGSSAYHGPIHLGYNGFLIGRNGWDGSNGFFQGNIQDLLITKGHRTTGSVPTELFPTT